MTWAELKTYIESHPDIHNDDVYVYDYSDGSEYKADIDEFKFTDELDRTVWVPSITINIDALED